MRKFVSIILMLMLVCLPALAETQISVSGSGTVFISADYAVVTLGVQAWDKTVMGAQSQVNATIAAIREALAETFDILEKDISTDRINIYTYYDSSWTTKVEYYNASQSLQIKVGDLNRIGAVIDAAFGAGANSLSSIEYYANDSTATQEQAMILAVEDATAKAQVLAEALGLKISSVESVSQSSSYYSSYSVSNTKYAPAAEAAFGDYSPTLVQPDKINVTMSVNISFIADKAE